MIAESLPTASLPSTDAIEPIDSIPENLDRVHARIREVAVDAGRSADDVTLIAVSKTHDAKVIEQVLTAGQRKFGENRIQEAEGKWPALKAKVPECELHLIGPLQTNKVKEAVSLFDVIQTLNRSKLARALAKEIDNQNRPIECFVQVNTGEERQKSGVIPRAADDFIRSCRDEFSLDVTGLMCIPPADEEPSLHFALLRTIAKRNGLAKLSMGMSADFEIAIAFGATHVRVGTAIFGVRKNRANRPRQLGPVDIHLSARRQPARCTIAAKLVSVFLYLVAMRRNCLRSQKKFSTRWRHLYIAKSHGIERTRSALGGVQRD